jgi:co-chaperonin GroES (HSP10)
METVEQLIAEVTRLKAENEALRKAFEPTLPSVHLLEDKVLLERIESKSKTDVGIIIPEQSREKSVFATVVACGPGRHVYGHFEPTPVEPGMKVILPKWSDEEVKIEGKKYMIAPSCDILAIVEE